MTLLRWLLAVAALDAVYLLTLASADPADAVVGAVIAVGVLILLGPFLRATQDHAYDAVAPPFLKRVIYAPLLVYAMVRDIIAGTWQVLGYSLGHRDPHTAGIVAVPIGERTSIGIAVSTLALTLSPGSTLVDIDYDVGMMMIHVLDATDPDGVRASFQRFYDRYQRWVFP